ncbi:YfmQ family protein [Neobacillus rhizosphaerae]|uniref:YfmQ family protein n=1 Tax=Neobacillus rhizosphaerae TaxID=2880965 RepID=UPI003D2955C2
MMWTIISIIVISLLKILMTCLPTGTVEWIIKKFDVHSKLIDQEVTVTLDGKLIEGEEKKQIIHDFNKAVFLDKQYIFPGTEELYLHPENSGPPIVIDSQKGKHATRLFVFRYEDHVDVVKQYKKKVAAYSILSDSLQKCSFSVTRDAV